MESAKEKGYDVLLMDGQLDVHWVGLLEQKLEKTRFVRVDSDTVEQIIEKEERKEISLSDKAKENLAEAVKSQLPKIEKTEFNVELRSIGASGKAIQITQNEFSRRMKEMSAMQQGMSFYGEMPEMYQVALNIDHPLIKQLIENTQDKEKDAVAALASEDLKLKQIIDLALLSNGMLKGEALNRFIQRSTEML